MSARSTITFIRLALLFYLAASPVVVLLAASYPLGAAPIVLIGALGVSSPLGLLLGRALRFGSEDEFAARYRALEGAFFLAAASSQAGVILQTSAGGAIATIGLALSAVGMMMASWLLWRVAMADGRGTRLSSHD